MTTPPTPHPEQAQVEALRALDRLDNAIRYAGATVARGNWGSRQQGEWATVHAGRAESSERLLRAAQDDVTLLRTALAALRPQAPQPCNMCGGTGELFIHADDCDDDLCALNGDMHSCVGQVVRCECQPHSLQPEKAPQPEAAIRCDSTRLEPQPDIRNRTSPEAAESRITITLRQAEKLVAFFGGHDAEITIAPSDIDSHSGPGLYAWCTDYPEEGSEFLGLTEVDDDLAMNGRAAEPVPAPVQPDTLSQQLQRRCVEMGTYWRAPDAHGVNLTIEQATELLRDALGVEVDIAAPPVRDAARWLTEQDRADLERVEELFSDGEGWDLPKARMQRLAELGVIRRTGGSYYAITSFGMHCLYPGDWPPPLFTAEEYNERSRRRAALAQAGDKEHPHDDA